MHPAENRGYRELYLTGRQLVGRWSRLAEMLAGTPAAEPLQKTADSVDTMLTELEPLTARHNLYSRIAAQGTGARLGHARAAVGDRFTGAKPGAAPRPRRPRARPTLLAYLAQGQRGAGRRRAAEFCRTWERRLRRQLGAARKAAVAMGEDPDSAIAPLDPSKVGRAAHGAAYAAGTVGEWVDRRVARRRS